jgi:hypothetical protein
VSMYDILDDRFPHGTVKGYDRGCRTNHCPAPIACHVFRTRYVGDFAFRRLVDAGWTAGQIAEKETAEAEEARRAERQSRARRIVEVSHDYQRWTQIEKDELRRLHRDGHSLRDIAKMMGRSFQSVRHAAVKLELGRRTVTQKNGIVRRPWSDADLKQLRALHAEGLHDGQIGDRMGRSLQSVWDKRKQLRLPAHPRMYGKGTRLTHGGITGYNRGCHGADCPATPTCGEIGRAYTKERAAAKRAGMSVTEYRKGKAA